MQSALLRDFKTSDYNLPLMLEKVLQPYEKYG